MVVWKLDRSLSEDEEDEFGIYIKYDIQMLFTLQNTLLTNTLHQSLHQHVAPTRDTRRRQGHHTIT